MQAPAPPGAGVPWLALIWLVGMSAAGGLVLVLAPQWPPGAAGWLPLLVVAPALALWLVQTAAVRGGWALALLAGAILLLSDADLRGAADPGSGLQGAAKFGLWLLGLLLLCWRGALLRRALGRGPMAWLALFGLWCLVSTAWSATPAYTAAAAVAWLGLWAAAVVTADSFTPQQALRAMAAALALAMLLSLLLLAVEPALALSPMDNGRLLRLSGIFASPNNLGRAAALLLLVVVLALRESRPAEWPWLLLAAGLGAACLVLSESRGSMAGLAVAVGLVIVLRRPLLGLLLAGLAAATALMLALEPQVLEAAARGVARSGSLEEVSSFTGRTDIWAAGWRLIGQAPWLGHGYASSHEVLPAAYQGAYGWTTTSAHNLWLQAWLTTGAVGLGLLLAAQATWLGRLLRAPLVERDAVVLFVLVVGLLEAGPLGPSVNAMTFVWLWAMALGRQRQGG